AGDTEIHARAVVALHEHTDGIASVFCGKRVRRGANASFVATADHTCATAHVAFLDGTGFRGVDGVEGVLGLDVKPVDVVEPAVPRFGDDGERPPVAGRIGLAVRDAPLNDRVADHADAVRVGDHHWAFEEAGLFDPGRAGHFAVAVERPPAGEHRIAHGILAARQYCGDASA